MCVKTVRCTGHCLRRMAALTCCTLQIGTYAYDLACNASFCLALPSSSITGYNVTMAPTLCIVIGCRRPRQSDRRTGNIWHANRMPRRRSGVSARRNLSTSAIVPSSRTAVRTVLMCVCLVLKWNRKASLLLVLTLQ